MNYLIMFALLHNQYTAVARILTHSVNLTFKPKIGLQK